MPGDTYVESDELPLRYGEKRWVGERVWYNESWLEALLLLALEGWRRLGRALHFSDLVSLSPDPRRGTMMGDSSFLMTIDIKRGI